MDGIQALYEAARRSDTPVTKIGLATGRSAAYVSSRFSKGGNPSALILAELLEPCGYKLCAVPEKEVPKSAIEIG